MTCDACTCGDKPEPAQTCVWTLAADNIDDDHWATACGKQYLFFEGGPKANGMAFCCYCGLPLTETPPTMECDDDD